MYKILKIKDIRGVKKKLVDMTTKYASEVLRTYFNHYLTILAQEAPVCTGQYLGSFRVSSKNIAEYWQMTDEEKKKRNPYLRGGKLKEGHSPDQNRQDAINELFNNYETRQFSQVNTANGPMSFKMFNNSPHARDINEGGPMDWTNGAYIGQWKEIHDRALRMAKLVKITDE